MNTPKRNGWEVDWRRWFTHSKNWNVLDDVGEVQLRREVSVTETTSSSEDEATFSWLAVHGHEHASGGAPTVAQAKLRAMSALRCLEAMARVKEGAFLRDDELLSDTDFDSILAALL